MQSWSCTSIFLGLIIPCKMRCIKLFIFHKTQLSSNPTNEETVSPSSVWKKRGKFMQIEAVDLTSLAALANINRRTQKWRKLLPTSVPTAVKLLHSIANTIPPSTVILSIDSKDSNMTEDEKSASVRVPNCIFCRIAKKETSLTPRYLDTGHADYVCFPDHRPAGKHHYLVIPDTHVKSVNILTQKDVPLVKKLEEIALKVLENEGADMNDVLLGFHWPLYSVGHLHIHAISPTNEMSFFQKIEFSRLFFGSPEKAIKALEKRADK